MEFLFFVLRILLVIEGFAKLILVYVIFKYLTFI